MSSIQRPMVITGGATNVSIVSRSARVEQPGLGLEFQHGAYDRGRRANGDFDAYFDDDVDDAVGPFHLSASVEYEQEAQAGRRATSLRARLRGSHLAWCLAEHTNPLLLGGQCRGKLLLTGIKIHTLIFSRFQERAHCFSISASTLFLLGELSLSLTKDLHITLKLFLLCSSSTLSVRVFGGESGSQFCRVFITALLFKTAAFSVGSFTKRNCFGTVVQTGTFTFDSFVGQSTSFRIVDI
ncbi:hypothetical protein C8R45DRAFT_1095629 [Mycena sanguinolenta]|nr:hypothetical protein C8R45DRAFT_1095629 [Mycena sanguinolenta]